MRSPWRVHHWPGPLSLEEILERMGLGRRVGGLFSEAYRRQWTERGLEEGIQGEGVQS